MLAKGKQRICTHHSSQNPICPHIFEGGNLTPKSNSGGLKTPPFFFWHNILCQKWHRVVATMNGYVGNGRTSAIFRGIRRFPRDVRNGSPSSLLHQLPKNVLFIQHRVSRMPRNIKKSCARNRNRQTVKSEPEAADVKKKLLSCSVP